MVTPYVDVVGVVIGYTALGLGKIDHGEPP